MRIFKTRQFYRWASSEALDDELLCLAIAEIQQGLVDANLGGYVFKKRIAVRGQGKSGGLRTLIALRLEESAFFLYGFAKNQRENITDNELKALKIMAVELLSYGDEALVQLLKQGKLVEITNHE